MTLVTHERRYAQLIATLSSRPGVSTALVRNKGLGPTALCLAGEIFAVLSSQAQLIVRLPRYRVDLLVAVGHGARFELFRGQRLSEWFVAGLGMEWDWLQLAEEALSFAAKARSPPPDVTPGGWRSAS